MVKRNFKFYRNDKGVWYITLPEWIGDEDDLQMIEGADKWLDLMSSGGDEVALIIANSTFEDAAFLMLIRLGEENLGGGGNYFLENFQSAPVGLKVWLCEVVEFIFDEYPQRIYFALA